MEYYEFHSMFPQIRMLKGIVGNFQLEGLNKGWVNIGKVFRTGYSQISAESTGISWGLLLILFGLRDTINKCWSSSYSCFYFRDLAEVKVGARDKIEYGRKHLNEVTIRDTYRMQLTYKTTKLYRCSNHSVFILEREETIC
jgi:hypothetical protein